MFPQLFVRDNPELCKKMKRVGTVKKVKEDQAAPDSQLHDGEFKELPRTSSRL